ncbi:MAG: hypothetical protein ACJ77B_04190 [Chloroflexota bacterium]
MLELFEDDFRAAGFFAADAAGFFAADVVDLRAAGFAAGFAAAFAGAFFAADVVDLRAAGFAAGLAAAFFAAGFFAAADFAVELEARDDEDVLERFAVDVLRFGDDFPTGAGSLLRAPATASPTTLPASPTALPAFPMMSTRCLLACVRHVRGAASRICARPGRGAPVPRILGVDARAATHVGGNGLHRFVAVASQRDR